MAEAVKYAWSILIASENALDGKREHLAAPDMRSRHEASARLPGR